MEHIPYNKPTIEDEEIMEVVDTLKSNWLTTGPKTKKFEKDFLEYTHAKYAVALNSCTAALHLALAAIDLKEGDEVITTPFTFSSTGEVIAYFKAKPVFVDIKLDTYNINPKLIEEKITKKTRAIIPVHYAGQPCDMDKILEIARKHNLIVIEDAAHAIAARYKEKSIGSISDFTCFSFYATKNLTTGEGGMLTTENDKWAEKVKILSLHGISKDAWKRYTKSGSWHYEIIDMGFKYNMNDLTASLGIQQLKKIEKFTKIREIIAEQYTNQLNEIPEITTPFVKTNIRHAWHLYQILLDTSKLKINRNEFIKELTEANIGVSVHFIPLHLHPFYKDKYGYNKGDFPVTESIYERIISLPIYPTLKKEEIKYITDTIKELIEKNRK